MRNAFLTTTLITLLVPGVSGAGTDAAVTADEARFVAVMQQMDAASKRLAATEGSLLERQGEIGGAVGRLLAAEAGISADLVVGREAEFGRALANLVRTFQMQSTYAHRANDALAKRDLEWLQYLKDKNLIEDAVRHDIAIKTPLFLRRAEWISRTGDLGMALDSITDATCFRDMVVADGFERTGLQISYLSPYKEVLDAGRKRGMFTLTEQEIHERFTTPTLQGYGKVLGVEVEVSPWNADRRITVRIVSAATGQSAAPATTANGPGESAAPYRGTSLSTL
ncbi:MAG: hypothetical protein FJ197_07330 [Gammaproteobacteria bacterium]|nr:hypothetical protein [Gammaproteobacteria bacterium]